MYRGEGGGSIGLGNIPKRKQFFFSVSLSKTCILFEDNKALSVKRNFFQEQ